MLQLFWYSRLLLLILYLRKFVLCVSQREQVIDISLSVKPIALLLNVYQEFIAAQNE